MIQSTAKLRWLTCLFALCLLVECVPDKSSNQTGEVGVKRHFDLKGYFDGEVQRLGRKGRAKKNVVVDGREETKLMDSVDFQRELGMFSVSDINRPAWSDKYVADSIFDEQKQLVHLEITSLDKSLKTQSIAVDFQQGAISKVQIHNNTTNSIASSNQVLTYEPSSGYSIESNQKVTFSDAQDFRIHVMFLK
jgi:hypothetical protein